MHARVEDLETPEPSPPAAPRSWYPLLWAAASAVGSFWCWQARGALSPSGYFHLDFARSLAEGRGFGVDGKAVFGDGSPLWVAMLAGTHLLLTPISRDWLVTGRVLAAAAALFFMGGLYRYGSTLVPTAAVPTRRNFALLVVLVVMLSPYWGAVAFSGSETLFTAGVACWGLAAVTGPLSEPLRPSRVLVGCACAGLAPLLRPEMLFFSLPLAPLLFVRWVNTPSPWNKKLFVFFAGMFLAVGPGASWLLYTVHTFGTGLPNTLGASRAAPQISIAGQLIARCALGCPWLLGAAAGAMVWLGLRYAGRHRAARAARGRPPVPTLAPTPGPLPRILLEPSTWVPFAWALFAAVFYLSNHLAITADAVLLIAPALTACVLAVLPTIWPRGFAAGVPLAMVYGVVTSALLTVPFLRAETARAEAYAALADAVGPLPARDRVALEPAGEVILLSRHPVVDLQGTLDPAALAFRWDPDDERRVPWAQAKGARYMVLDHLPEPGSTLVWSRDLPAERAGFGDGTPQPADRLLLWHLPPAPTLPPPALGLPETD